MFKNRALEMKVVKKNSDESAPPNPWTDPVQMTNIIKDTVPDIAKGVAALYAGKKLLDTAAQIAVIAAKAKLK